MNMIADTSIAIDQVSLIQGSMGHCSVHVYM